jgi:hypothetical protein
MLSVHCGNTGFTAAKGRTIRPGLVDGDRVALRSTPHGIPAGDPADASATLLEIVRVADGRIAELWAGTSISGLPR